MKEQPKSLKTIQYFNSNRQRTKLILLLIIIIAIMSTSISSAFAADKTVLNFGDWIDTSYYQNAYDHTGWSNMRVEAFDNAKNIVTKYNSYTKFNTSHSENMVGLINELMSDKLNKGNEINRTIGTNLKGKWITLGEDVMSIDMMARTYCAYGSDTPILYGDKTKVQSSDYNDLLSKCRDTNKSMTTLVEAIKKSYQEAPYNASEKAAKKVNALFKVANYAWKGLGGVLRTAGTGASGTSNFLGVSWTTKSMKSIANAVSAVTKSFAYCIIIILFGLNITNTMMQFEILSIQGLIKVFASLLIGKVWVDVSINVCAYILNIVNSLNSQLFDILFTGKTNLNLVDQIQVGNEADPSWWDYIGALINWLGGIIWHLPELIISIVILVCIISVMVKLVVRNFELTCLMTISPLAFSTIVNEETKVYFKKFIGAFISTAMYTTYMVITYIVGSQWLSELTSISNETSFVQGLISIIPRLIIIVGICRVMMKPPKVLTSLVD